MKLLSEMKIGQKAKLMKVGGQGELHRRLVDMGIVPGAILGIERIAPLGDPLDITVKGFHLSLRRSEAALLQVIPMEEGIQR